jgi:SAM-dependent methyltransferase
MASQESAADAFHAFELEGWRSIAAQYHQGFGELTVQAVEPLLEAARVQSGSRVLDVASGPGYAAAAAAARGAQVTGVDFAAPMVAHARARYPGLDFREADAECLPFSDRTFDAVTISFGLLHLARPELALAEGWRVLRPGGRIACTVWAKPEQAVAFGIVLRAVQRCGNPDVPLPPGPPFFRFSDAGASMEALAAAGFMTPEVIQVPQWWRLPSEQALFEFMQRATVRTGGLLRAQSRAALDAIGEAICAEASAYRRNGMVELPMPAVLASASKPELA